MADELLATIDAVYAAGLDARQWPQALGAMAKLVGGAGATLEIFDRSALAVTDFFSFGSPRASEIAYFDRYLALNPRVPDALRRKAGDVTWDYRILDESGIDRSPFYQEFLAPMGFRYNVVGVLMSTKTEFAAFTVQRSARQGHVQRAEIALTERLIPHVNRSIDMMRRLKAEATANQSFERTLDWLAEGVALIRANGTVAYANEAFQAIARSDDGFAIKKNCIEFATAGARGRFDAAIAGSLSLSGSAANASVADFAVERRSGAAPYVVSVRPLKLPRNETTPRLPVAMIFVHDPLNHGDEDTHLLREIFGFTSAEASLARALRRGIPLGDYGRSQRVTQNTIYTHLRRIKEKTGCRRLPELIGRLNDVRMLLRRS
jgi:DNA-binding CsgD family transcriptional regulator/PAS domain-containing protein